MALYPAPQVQTFGFSELPQAFDFVNCPSYLLLEILFDGSDNIRFCITVQLNLIVEVLMLFQSLSDAIAREQPLVGEIAFLNKIGHLSIV